MLWIFSFLFLASLGLILFQCGIPFWGGGDPLIEKLRDWSGKQAPYAFSGRFGKLGTALVLGMMFCQKLKFSFVNLLWLETNLFIEDGPQTLVQFFDWVGVT